MKDKWEENLSCAIRCAKCGKDLGSKDERVLSVYDHEVICMHVRKNKRHGTITRRSRKKSSVNVWPSKSRPWWTPEDTAFTTSIPTSADQQKKAIFGALQPYPPPIRFALRVSLVSIQKWPFSPISASICRISCATYHVYVSAQSLDLLDLAENCLFLNWKLKLMPIFLDFHFWMGISLGNHHTLNDLTKNFFMVL